MRPRRRRSCHRNGRRACLPARVDDQPRAVRVRVRVPGGEERGPVVLSVETEKVRTEEGLVRRGPETAGRSSVRGAPRTGTNQPAGLTDGDRRCARRRRRRVWIRIRVRIKRESGWRLGPGVSACCCGGGGLLKLSFAATTCESIKTVQIVRSRPRSSHFGLQQAY